MDRFKEISFSSSLDWASGKAEAFATTIHKFFSVLFTLSVWIPAQIVITMIGAPIYFILEGLESIIVMTESYRFEKLSLIPANKS